MAALNLPALLERSRHDALTRYVHGAALWRLPPSLPPPPNRRVADTPLTAGHRLEMGAAGVVERVALPVQQYCARLCRLGSGGDGGAAAGALSAAAGAGDDGAAAAPPAPMQQLSDFEVLTTLTQLVRLLRNLCAGAPENQARVCTAGHVEHVLAAAFTVPRWPEGGEGWNA